ncbi:hypothetical protein IVA80_10850 [Bradyrhizobium sp. 139]|uniref:hypothetical protein n=1 Tax=Bradyrhizobium sp. 139 TaxID=2782616 RepID=UPI001FF8BB1F|nr:hypothetical protein [Bradyrhizobium sp. 139]MCK1741348.1 hypothetical protein [Bradyrhizobium sp. 139]
MSKNGGAVQKLTLKAKQFAMKERYGSFKPLMGKTPVVLKDKVTRKGNVVDLHRPERWDVADETPKNTAPKARKFIAPVKEGYRPRPFGKRGLSGCVYRPH